MNRNDIMKCLDSVAGTYPPSTKPKSQDLAKWIVVMKKDQKPSLSSSKGGWLYFDILCYVDKGSILPLDGLVEDAKAALRKLDVEFTGIETPDFFDTELEAFMISFEIRIPKEVG